MTRRLTKPIVVAIGIFTANWANAQDLSSVAATFYSQIGPAMTAKDLKGLDRVYRARIESGFIYQESSGTIRTEQEMLRVVARDLGMFGKLTTVRNAVRAIKLKGNHAMVIVDHRFVGPASGPGPKTPTISISGATQDVWVVDHGDWKLSKESWIGHLYTRDGKLFQPPKN